MSNRVTHFEIPSSNPEETMSFFKSTFDWSFQKLGLEEYWFAITGDEKLPGINGGLIKKKSIEHPLVISIEVSDIDIAIEKIKKSGGKIALPKMPIPTVGWVAYFKDPEGNIHGLWQDDQKVK